MCPSGSKPFGNKDSKTNSGRVSSSSLETVNRVPLRIDVRTDTLALPRPFIVDLLPEVKGDLFVAADIYISPKCQDQYPATKAG
jgi:hypothetical protein